jgi:hypothetical protein
VAAAPPDGGPHPENYSYYLGKHILPTFGTMRLIEILPVDVREWVTDMKNTGVSPTVIRSCFAILSAIFTTAFNDQLTSGCKQEAGNN